jgi:mono/diheme cytochrome c family protein
MAGRETASKPDVKVPTDLQEVAKNIDKAAAERGKALVQADSKGKCVLCHSPSAKSFLPSDFRFVPNEKDDPAHVNEAVAVMQARAKEGFLDRLDQRLVKSKTMPPIANVLTGQDRDDIEAYLKSLLAR